MVERLDMTVPVGPQAGAYADGYDVRLQGLSRYAVPYGKTIDGPLVGWRTPVAAAWWLGWDAADRLCQVES